MRLARSFLLPYLLACAVLPNAGACNRGGAVKTAGRVAGEVAEEAGEEAARRTHRSLRRHPGGRGGKGPIGSPLPSPPTATGFSHKLDEWRKRYPEAGVVMQQSICDAIAHVMITESSPTLDDLITSLEDKFRTSLVARFRSRGVPVLEALTAAGEVADLLSMDGDTLLAIRLRISHWEKEECTRY